MNKPLQIAFITNDFPCISETFILHQIIGLLELGHNVDIFAYNKKAESGDMHSAVLTYQLLNRSKYFPVIPENRSKRFWRLLRIFVTHIFRNPGMLRRCLNFKKYGAYQALNHLFHMEPLMHKKYDVVHCQYGTLGQQWRHIKDILLDTKLVVSFRGYDLTRIVYAQGRGFYQELFARADAFLPVCKYFAFKLHELGCPKEKIHVLSSGINIQQLHFQERHFDFQKKIRILSVGRLVEKKGIRYAVCAVGALVKRHPNIQYTIVGSGPMEQEIRLLIKTLELEDHVTLIDHLNDERMVDMYYQSHIFLLPCVQAEDNDQEGVPNVLKEAMATGMPVISTWHSGIPELIQNGVNGFLVPERDVDGLVQQCARLISDPALCMTLGKNGHTFVDEQFDYRKLTSQLVNVYVGAMRTEPEKAEVKQHEHRLSC